MCVFVHGRQGWFCSFPDKQGSLLTLLLFESMNDHGKWERNTVPELFLTQPLLRLLGGSWDRDSAESGHRAMQTDVTQGQLSEG